jgi:glycosyltransferase involved in cell wall biosynthesis
MCEQRNLNRMSNPLTYVLITAARNEQALIDATIRSVVGQTVKPLRWIIVSDGSTDQTNALVTKYAYAHDWIELIRMPEHSDRQFAAKAHCVNAAYERLRCLEFDLIGNIDADITFDSDFFEYLIGKFTMIENLGIAGTPYYEPQSHAADGNSIHTFSDLNHVSGQCQLFRRRCFEEIGGYVPIKGGAIDWVAVRTARMKGWKTQSFVEKVFVHHRKMGTAERGVLQARFHYGQKAYYVGGHPLWELLKGGFEMRQKPWIVGGLFFILGYLWAWVIRMPRPVSRELIAFHRAEQMARLHGIYLRILGLRAE